MGSGFFRIQKGCKWKIMGKAESTKKMQRDPQQTDTANLEEKMHKISLGKKCKRVKTAR